jgi:flagellin-like protein
MASANRLRRERLMNRFKAVRAVSPIIATLLMIAITVVASLFAYAWVTGYLNFTTNKIGQTIQIQSVSNSDSTGHLQVYVQNVGQGSLRLDPKGSVYVNNKLQDLDSTDFSKLVLNPGDTALVQTAFSTTENQVKVRIVTMDGASSEIMSVVSSSVGTEYLVTFSMDDGGATLLPLAGSYNYQAGARVQIVATPDGTHEFLSWVSTGLILIDNANVASTTVTIHGQGTVAAHFRQQAPEIVNFFGMSSPTTTIENNPNAQHAFQPVHDSKIVEVDKVVDGATRKYLAYDSDPDGSQIMLYYTDDLAGSWVPYSGNPILGQSNYHFRWPSTTFQNGVFHMFLTNKDAGTLERWTSADGVHFEFAETVKVGGNIWKNPFVWQNPNDNQWYLYTHDDISGVECIKARSAGRLEDLATSSDTIVISKSDVLASPSVMFYQNKYWLICEEMGTGMWESTAYYSASSPSSGFVQCANSPILVENEACSMLFLNPQRTQAYLFVSKLVNWADWYIETRSVNIQP